MTRNGTLTALTPKQERFVTALMTSPDVKAACVTSHISVRTGWRWLASPDVKRALNEAQGALLEQCTRRLVAELSGALDTLRDIHSDTSKPPGVRVSAAGRFVDAGLKYVELTALEQRVTELERKQGG